MAERKFLFMAADGYQEEGATSDSITLGALTMGGDIAMGSNKVTGAADATTDGDVLVYGQSAANLDGLTVDTSNLVLSGVTMTGLPTTPTGDTEATSKAYVDQLVVTGTAVKEAVLYDTQLDDAEGMLAAGALVIAVNPVEDDFIELTDGTTTRQYEFGTALTTGDVLVAIGATPAITMASLAAAIEGDASAAWGSAFTTNLDAINSDGVVVIVEDDNDGTVTKLYGTWATQANCDVIDFDGELDYTSKTLTDLPTSAPANSNFGVRRTQSALTDGEMHNVLESDVIYSWDDSGNTWQTYSGSGSIPDATAASGGGVKGKVTFDSDLGLAVSAGVASLNITADLGLHFNSGALEIELDNTPDTLDADADGLKVVGLPSLFKINDTAVGATVTAANLDTLTDTSNADALHDHTGSSVSLAHSDLSGVTSDQHHAQVHVLTGADHTESGLTTGHVLTATGATTFDWAAPGDAQDAQRILNDLVAVENVAKADPVYNSATADKFGKADAGTDAKSYVFGVAKDAILADATGEVVSYGIAAGILVGATAGAKYYLGDGGGITTSIPGAAKRIIMIGWAKNATDLWVQPIDFGKKAA